MRRLVLVVDDDDEILLYLYHLAAYKPPGCSIITSNHHHVTAAEHNKQYYFSTAAGTASSHSHRMAKSTTTTLATACIQAAPHRYYYSYSLRTVTDTDYETFQVQQMLPIILITLSLPLERGQVRWRLLRMQPFKNCWRIRIIQFRVWYYYDECRVHQRDALISLLSTGAEAEEDALS